MRFAIMVWTSKDAKMSSIFGVLDADNPRPLPAISNRGHWSDYRAVEEDRFPDAAAAKESITAVGYYLMGACVSVSEAFGENDA